MPASVRETANRAALSRRRRWWGEGALSDIFINYYKTKTFAYMYATVILLRKTGQVGFVHIVLTKHSPASAVPFIKKGH